MNSVPIKILYIAISDGLSSSNEYLIIKRMIPKLKTLQELVKNFKTLEFEA